MSLNKKVKFECKECESDKLAYQKYSKSVIPVELKKDGTIYYSDPDIDDDDYLAVSNGFCCKNCGHMLKHCGCNMETEEELLAYLTMDPEVSNKEQADYEECLRAQIEAEKELDEADRTVSIDDMFDLI